MAAYPYPKGNLLIPAPHGELEALYRPTNLQAARVALVLHPHPQFGGTMHNKVVVRAARALQEAGFETLRFNFRGVGYSSGVYDEGRGETEDARTALDYLLAQQPHAREVLIAGFSFGSAVGMRLGCTDQRVQRLIAIGAPARLHDVALLSSCAKPMLFVHGELDEVAPLAPLRELLAQGPPDSPHKLVIIAGAGHFFDDQLPELMRVIKDYVS
jgi:uncharacterized protein